MQKIIDGLNKYYYIIFFLFGFFLPLSTKLANVFFAISMCYMLVFAKKNKFSFIKRKFILFSSILLFIPCLVSLFTIDISPGLINTFLKRSPYLFSPIIFFFLAQQKIPIIKKNALRGIAWGSFLSAIILLTNIFIKYFFFSTITNKTGGIFNYYHTNKFFTDIIEIHPTYIGVYFLFSFFLILSSLKERLKIALVLKVLIIFVAIVFINSRIILILTGIVIFYFFTFFIVKDFKKSNKIKSAVISLIGASVLICSFYFLKKTYVYHKLTKELKWELQTNSSTKYNSKTFSDSRLSRWKVAADLIMERPIFGYGLNKEIKILKKGYREAGLIHAYKEEYNSHNQFLGYSIEGGLISFVGLLLFFGYSLFLGLIRKDSTSVFLMVLIAFVCLAENYLIRNAGILFVAFFTSLFLIEKRQLKQSSIK